MPLREAVVLSANQLTQIVISGIVSIFGDVNLVVVATA